MCFFLVFYLYSSCITVCDLPFSVAMLASPSPGSSASLCPPVHLHGYGCLTFPPPCSLRMVSPLFVLRLQQ